jgi:hypothetical protein
MSATLTWHKSGLGTKTGTANANLITDIKNLVLTKAGDADFKWEVADFSTSTPMYVSLKRKDASDGRILFAIWSSAPAAVNVDILDQSPQTSVLFGAYFPNGNTDSAINLAAASGAILGDNTGCTKVATGYFVSSMYTTNYQSWYFDSEEGMVWGFQDPGGTQTNFMMFGDLVIDDADNVYPCVVGGASGSLGSMGSSSPPLAWTSSPPSAGAFSVAYAHVVYPSTVSKPFYQAFACTGAWGAQVGTPDVLNDSSNSKVYFEPIPLVGQTKGQGIKLKLRQLALGPGSTSAFNLYNGTGPVPMAYQCNGAVAGGVGFPYAVNFKL